MTVAYKDVPVGYCPTAPLREAFERSGKSYAEVALALGWYATVKGRQRADATRLRRALGASPESNSGKPRVMVNAELASRLAEAIGVLPVEIGL